ncbi:lactococcin 972 family bacteriocin [Listeria innocua]|uniref:Bacteriocin, lactococcin 972 family n=1 Tax=Listeria innocua ATCC 33091 TaxID=1002366 RepID=A0AB72Z585_LISIO|nr:lactococcin 972 family bacteriocin [Listeria innocua]EAA0093776.1 lactococcin 972 family bacteriocin [Listeria innocua]EAC4267522.1 lactococcin 972 family bacteriocin [Listeria innocua]EAD5680313.1 lactococcin 972 family bacteriocin [Listeria innocua]EAF5651764.1 lactococcin 972 family bacteriocin [Listeria innocua]EAG8539587.1 lactococcin 972 family bacteriocin [Listeria innocua]
MKKKVCVLAIALLTVLSPVGALATENLAEGEISLDSLMKANETGEKTIFSETATGKNPLLKKAKSAGGGTFWVTWGQDRHSSNYQHYKKMHRSSASNFRTTVRSRWQPKGKLASVWIKSSLWGNKANWATK